MKRSTSTLATLAACILTTILTHAQVPDGIGYQAVLRDAAGAIMENRTVSIRFTIHENGASGPVEYQEMHPTTTNDQGLIVLKIGMGTPLVGIFTDIDWAVNEKWLKVDVDLGTGFVTIGAQQILSVPFAYIARYVENDMVDDADNDPTNELQTISKAANVVTLSHSGGSFVDEVDDADNDPTNELQSISRVGNTVTLSQGGGSVSVDDADADPTNELNQSMNLTGTSLNLTDADGVLTVELSSLVDDADADPTNELNQTMNLTGTTLNLMDAGGTLGVDLSSLIDDADADPTNELIQTVTFDGSTLSVSDPGGVHSVNLSSLQNDADNDPTNELNQTMTFVGTTLNLTDAGGTLGVNLSSLINDADADPTNELNQAMNFVGTTLSLTDAGGTFNVNLGSLIDDADADPTNELQTISASGTTNQLSIDLDLGGGSVELLGAGATTLTRSGNSITISSTDEVNDADNDPTNELQSFVLTGSASPVVTLNPAGNSMTFTSSGAVTLSRSGNTIDIFSTDEVDDADNDPTNELNTGFTVAGGNLNITDAGGTLSVALTSLDDGDWTGAGTGSMRPTDLSDNIGIGTNSPQDRLHVVGGDVIIQRDRGLRSENSPNVPIELVALNLISSQPIITVGEPTSTWNGIRLYTPSVANTGVQVHNGTETIAHFDVGGNVGIGTILPQTKLHIVGGSDAQLTGATSGYIVTGSVTGLNLVIDNDEIMARNNGAMSALHLQADGGDLFVHNNTAASTKAIFTSTGSLGLGTTSPSEKLHIADTDVELRLEDTDDNSVVHLRAPGDGSSGGVGTVTNHSFRLFTNDTERMIVASTGQVGIGTSSPTATLDVNGTFRYRHATAATNYLMTSSDASGNAVWTNPTALGLVTGTGTSTRVAFWNSSTSLSSNSNLFWDNTTSRLGVGTSTPLASLHVAGGAIRPLDGNVSTAGINWGSNLYGGAGDEAFIRYYSEGGEDTKLMIGNSDDANDDIGFFQFGAERMTIRSGNVGIGTTNPSSNLHVSSNASTVTIEDEDDASIIQIVAPGISYKGGIGTTTAHDLPLFTDNTDRVTIKTGTGRVGIGTVSPSSMLHVTADEVNAVQRLRNSNASGFSSTTLESSGGTSVGHFGYGNASAASWTNQVFAGSITSIPFVFTTTNLERMRISSAGNVGIGTSTPSEKLHVSSTSAHIRLDDSDDASTVYLSAPSGADPGGVGTTTAHDFPVFTSGVDRLTVKAAGNVGIGTSSPTARLHVMNNVAADIVQRLRNQNTTGFSSMTFESSGGSSVGHIGYGNASAASFADQVYVGSITAIPFVLTTSNTERVRIAADGSVGVGTSTPSERLHVSSTAAHIRLDDSDDASTIYISAPSAGDPGGIGTTTAHDFPIFTGGTDRMTVTSIGNVGIATSTPVNRLNVQVAADDGVRVDFSDNTSQGIMRIRGTAGGATNYAELAKYGSASGTMIGGVSAADGARLFSGTSSGPLFLQSGGTAATNDIYLTTGSTIRMTVDGAAGNVGIGTTSPSVKLHVSGNVQADATGGTNFNFRGISPAGGDFSSMLLSDGDANGISMFGDEGTSDLNIGDVAGVGYEDINASGFNVVSDRTMKRNVTEIGADDAQTYMNMIRTIETARFRYITETDEQRPVDHIGVIAQSLPEELQKSVSTTPSGSSSERVLAVSLSDLAGLTLVGVKALDQRQTEMEQIIANQQQMIEELQRQIEELRK